MNRVSRTIIVDGSRRKLLDSLLHQQHTQDRSAAIRPRDPGAVVPLTSAQERIWYFEQLNPRSTAFVVSICMRLTFRVDETAFQNALRDLIERHEALRTRFEVRNARPIQIVEPAIPF